MALHSPAHFAHAQPFNLPGRTYTSTDRYVSTNVFHWFSAGGGQQSGPWRPVEGRINWTGQPDFWQRQVKDMMDANIDVLHVHLMPDSEQQRINLFTALSQLRSQGYNVPQVAPFLDPLITWSIHPPIDVSTPAGKDEFVNQYIRFYNQYFGANTDAQAESYILHIAGKPVLNTWHCNSGFVNNMNSLTRADVESRLITAFGATRPSFNNGIYMIGTVNGTAPSFSDEKMFQFSNTEYESDFVFNGKKTATMKPGYWDQNVRNPGIFFARNGGTGYRNGWITLVNIRDGGNGVDGQNPAQPIYHANIESWNEYDEGTGIYSGDPGPPYIAPANQSGNTDTWSSTNNPREYIDTSSTYGGQFNGLRPRDARILSHDIPTRISPGQTLPASIIVRNEGNAEWSAASNYKLGRPNEVLLDSHFNADASGWTLVQNAFGTTGNTTFENGDWGATFGAAGGGLRTRTGNVNTTLYSNGASTAWAKTIHVETTTSVAINFKWRLFLPTAFESDERGEARFELNNQQLGLNSQIYLARFTGGRGVNQDTGWQEYTLLTTLNGPADYTLEIGSHNNKKNQTDEVVEVYIDDVVILDVSTPAAFGDSRYLIDDGADEIPTYGGVFRGRPKAFDFSITAPLTTGLFDLHFQMLQESIAWFGERLDVQITVAVPPDLDADNDVDQVDFGNFQNCFSGETILYMTGCEVADFDLDIDVDRFDFAIYQNCFSGPNTPPNPSCVP